MNVNEVETSKNLNTIFGKELIEKADLYEKERVKTVLFAKTVKISAIILICWRVLSCLVLNIKDILIKNPEVFNSIEEITDFFVPRIIDTIVDVLPLIIMFLFIVRFIKYIFIKKIKQEFYPEIIKTIGPELKYKSHNMLNFSSIENLIDSLSYNENIKINGDEIFPPYDNYKFSIDDIIYGTYNSKDVKIIEFNYSGYDNDRESNYTYNWHGVAFQTSMDKPFDSTVVVTYKNKSFSYIAGTKKITLESEEFNKIYNVYGADEVETRYFLTTSLMERLINIHKRGQLVALYVSGTDITIFKQTDKDMFEPDIEKPINNVSSFDETLNETKGILDYITTLKLDSNVGL